MDKHIWSAATDPTDSHVCGHPLIIDVVAGTVYDGDEETATFGPLTHCPRCGLPVRAERDDDIAELFA